MDCRSYLHTVTCENVIPTLLKMGCDRHTNHQSHHQCDWLYVSLSVTVTPKMPFTPLHNHQPLFIDVVRMHILGNKSSKSRDCSILSKCLH